MEFELILASASPRRRELLEQAGVAFRVHAVDVDESLDADDLAQPAEAVKKLAERKARVAIEQLLTPDYVGSMIVLGSDTMVALGSQVFGKPGDRDEAEHMLRTLSGRTHQVHTGVSVWMVDAPADGDISLAFRTFVDTSHVSFRTITEDELASYLATDEPYDKAGAYAVQGTAGAFVEGIDGALDTVIGLPVERLLREFPDIPRISR